MEILSYLKKQQPDTSAEHEASMEDSTLESHEESGISSLVMVKSQPVMPSSTPGTNWDPFLSQDLKLVDREAQAMVDEGGMEQKEAYGKALDYYLSDKEGFRKEAGQRQRRQSQSAEEAVAMVWQYAKELAEEGTR